MPKVSVLMSVYNEKFDELQLAVKSVLNQTFKEFEFILVCDNPDNHELKQKLFEIADSDNRVNIVWNKTNIGLALSLNAASEVASGEYLIRMDADDICVLDRFERQIKLIEEGKYDLIWSSYFLIDENGNDIEGTVDEYADNQIAKILPLVNIVHHPTVIMKRSSFEDVGKYRNFPCAQDYDLWLRMLYQGYKMHMMKDKLLYYRVRKCSVTGKRKYQQLCTLDYIRHIYREKIRNGNDIYSYDGYLSDMKRLGVGDGKVENAFRQAQAYVVNGKKLCTNHQYLSGVHELIRGMIVSPFYRRQIFLKIKRKKVMKDF